MPEDQRTPAADELSDLAAQGAAMARDERLAVLGAGRVEVVGRMPWSSNATFLVLCQLDGIALPAVYKPEDGERPLWDFPPGIYRREVATYELSERLGLSLVPETLARHDAPFGVGSLQRFVPADFAQHYFTLLEDGSTHGRLRELAAFDVLCNNADRKGGHVLAEADGTIWAIDNGLTFHAEPKLRTVAWEFAGDPVPDTVAAGLARLAEEPGLQDLLDGDECAALAGRARRLAASGRLPHPDRRRHHVPWPLV
jgi:uncharacterized repeat protein (TIGR03843 family)